MKKEFKEKHFICYKGSISSFADALLDYTKHTFEVSEASRPSFALSISRLAWEVIYYI